MATLQSEGFWTPNGPYIIGSGKRAGKALELLMFSDYYFLQWHFDQLEERLSSGSSRNIYHRHLGWLLNRGENRRVPMACPSCNTKPIKLLSIRGVERFGYSMHQSFSCCDDEECITRIYTEKQMYLPVKFSSILNFRLKSDQKQFVNVLRDVFGLIGRLTKEKAFDFFRA